MHRNKVPICSKGSNSSVSPPPSPKKPTTTEHPPLRRRVGQSSHAQNPPPPQACPPRWRWRRQMGHIVFLPWPMPTGWSYRGREHWAGGCCVLPISCPSPAMHRSPQRGGGGGIHHDGRVGFAGTVRNAGSVKALWIPQGGEGPGRCQVPLSCRRVGKDGERVPSPGQRVWKHKTSLVTQKAARGFWRGGGGGESRVLTQARSKSKYVASNSKDRGWSRDHKSPSPS